MMTGQHGDDDDLAPIADINVTPFIDVMLVLLVIFMVTAPLLAAGMKVDLPQARAPETLDSRKPVVLTVSADGRIQIGDRDVQRVELIASLRNEGAAPDRHIHVRGDARVGYADMVEILDLLAVNGFSRVALVTRIVRDGPPVPR